MSLLRAASSLPRIGVKRAPMLARHYGGPHVENAVRHNMPFGYTSKPKFALFFFGFGGTLFVAPFIVIEYQLVKGGFKGHVLP